MNSKQLKILIIKILPGAIFLSIKVAFVVIVLGYMFIKIFFINPENQKHQEKINSLQSQNERLQKQTEKEDVLFNKLYIPLDGWSVQETNLPEKFKNGVMYLANKNEDIVCLLCTIHDYNTDIHEYSKYQNEKLVRNMGSEGVILTSKTIEDIKFNNIDAVKETFDQTYKPTGENSTFISINFKYLGCFYTIEGSETSDVYSLISKIKLEK